MNILVQLSRQRSALSKAEMRVADAVLDDPNATVNMTTAELARKADVSDPMVSRFCRSLGCSGFPEFKVKLAQGLTQKISYISEDIAADDSPSRYIEKRINANQAALEYIRGKLDPNQIDRAVKQLQCARQIILCGLGGAAAIAQDAQHKLFRLGIPTVAYDDHLMQRMAAANAKDGDCFVLFSFTGRTEVSIEVAELARANKAVVIAITNPDSPLGRLADITITSGGELEDTTIYVPMTTRIVVLTIVDILATGLALAQGPDIARQLKKIKQSLDDTKRKAD